MHSFPQGSSVTQFIEAVVTDLLPNDTQDLRNAVVRSCNAWFVDHSADYLLYRWNSGTNLFDVVWDGSVPNVLELADAYRNGDL